MGGGMTLQLRWPILNLPPYVSIVCFTAADWSEVEVKMIQTEVVETVHQDVQAEDTQQQQGVHLLISARLWTYTILQSVGNDLVPRDFGSSLHA